jgi:hypothetical protein
VRQRVRPEEIIGEWGVRDVTPPSQRERDRLARDADLNPLIGKPLRRRLRNFSPDPTTYLASVGGPLPYMQRARRIDEETEAHLARLEEAYAESGGDPVVWRRIAETWDFGETNELIDKHNRYFPIEARLPMDPKTRDYVRVGGRPYRRRPLDAAWILERFPVAAAS